MPLSIQQVRLSVQQVALSTQQVTLNAENDRLTKNTEGFVLKPLLPPFTPDKTEKRTFLAPLLNAAAKRTKKPEKKL
ncbi:MAG: hypothetical protein AB7P01_12025 [Bacteroidia bacterium]